MHARIPFEACPLCEHQSADLVGEASCVSHPLFKAGLPETMRWIRCTGCGHVFTDGYFDEPAMALLFSGANAGQLPGHEIGPSRQLAARIVERVVGLRGGLADGLWVDVGFGNGALLTTAAEFGFDVLGLDLRAQAVERLRDFGVDARCERFEDAQFDRAPAVISFADVLEHMPFPTKALVKAARIMAPGGLLFASMPNLDAFYWQALDAEGKNPYWAELEHYHNFGRKRLSALLEAHGFSPVSYGVSQRYLASMELISRRSGE